MDTRGAANQWLYTRYVYYSRRRATSIRYQRRGMNEPGSVCMGARPKPWTLSARPARCARVYARPGMKSVFCRMQTHAQAEELLNARLALRFYPFQLRWSIAKLNRAPANYSEILLQYGYADRVAVSGLVRGWLGLFNLVSPDVVVIDYAPTAVLAARIKALRCCHVRGRAFEIPPLSESTTLDSTVGKRTCRNRLQIADKPGIEYHQTKYSRYTATQALIVWRSSFENHPTLLTTFAELDYFGPSRTR